MGKLRLQKKLQDKIKQVFAEHIQDGLTEFYCGGYGNFDAACACILRDLKTEYPQIRTYYMTPYIGKGAKTRLKTMKVSGLYDDILYPELESVPPKFAIEKRNRYMIDVADLVIFYVEHAWGGAYNALLYARRKNKHILYIEP